MAIENAARFEHGGNIHRAARSAADGRALLDFSANINPLGLSLKVRAALAAELDGVVHYPDPEGYALKHALTRVYQVDAPQITLGNGAVELLYVLCHVLRPRRVLIPAPSFSEYERAARAAGAKIHYHTLTAATSFQFDVAAFCAALPGCDMTFLGNPNNPTGALLTVREVAQIIAAAQAAAVFVVVDESFLDFLGDSEAYTAKRLIDQYDNVLVLHSLTKFYAIPGLRLGFAVANPLLTKRLHAAKDPWNVNSLAQAAGVAALADRDYQAASREFIAREKREFYRALQGLHACQVYCPAVNFVLVALGGTNLKANELRALCLAEGILIRDCTNYPGLSEYYVRFAIKSKEENNRLLAVLEKIFGR